MKFRSVLYASVCSVLLAASAAAPAVAGASENSPNALAVKAMDALSSGDAKSAVELFNEAIESRKLAPETLAHALLNRGLARQKLGLHDKAIGDYEAALRLDALSAHARAIALYNRGLAWRAKGMAGRAIEDFTSALFLDPYFAQGYYSRANILHGAGQLLFALADYDKALKYGYPQPQRVHLAKALIFKALRRAPDAKAELYAALKAKPDYAPARRQLAALLKGKGVTFASIAPVRPAPGARKALLRTASLGRAQGVDLNLRKKAQPAPVAPPAVARAPQDGPATKDAPSAPRKQAPAAHEAPVAIASARETPRAAPARPEAKKATAMTLASLPAAKPERDKGRKLAIVPANAPAPAQVIHAGMPESKSVAGKTAKITYSGWAIQLASQRSEEGAWGNWKKLKPRVARVVRNARPVVMKAEIKGRGIYYRLRLVGFGDRNLARRLCARIKRKGASCLVTRAGS